MKSKYDQWQTSARTTSFLKGNKIHSFHLDGPCCMKDHLPSSVNKDRMEHPLGNNPIIII